jgi:hypothetical protein
MRLISWILCALLAASPALAEMSGPSQVMTVPTPGTLQSTNTVQTCGPQTAVLGAAGDSVTLPCAGASNYLITFTTPSGQTPLIGVMNSTDSTTGGARRLVKTGIGPLEVATETLNGAQGAGATLEYRTVGGGYGQKISLSSYTSGQATVTIMAMYQPTTIFVNGAVHDEQDVALRNGRSFTASTGIQTVSAGNFLSMQFSMPAGANRRAFISLRALGCSMAAEFAGVSNPTANPATTPASITNRKTGGATSVATATYSMASTHPDTAPAATSPAGGLISAYGTTYLGKDYQRTVEPGTSFTNWIGGAGGGLGTASRCHITYLWSEEPIN